ncbi:MAG TPA: hypothetical protein VJT84_13905 [Gaiellaceae bacterium]|nr:hypothetical protein [Gaiellaceae bacterium]
MLSRMWWRRYWKGVDRLEDSLARLRERVVPPAGAAAIRPVFEDEDAIDLRLFPIVGRDVCYPVAALLSRGKLEEAGRLVSDRAWVASTPLYG